MQKKLIVISGPTASGKSNIALSLAKALGTKIISADSMQVYKGLEFITFGPQGDDLSYHYLVSFLPPDQEYDAGRFVTEARPIINGLWENGKIPIVAGGTGMYIKTLLEGIFPVGSDEAIRSRIMAEADEKGLDSLYLQLREIDPVAAQKIHPNDKRRLVRALEVYRMTGRPISQWQARTSGLNQEAEVYFYILMPQDRAWLRERIDRRIEERIDNESVEKLAEIRKSLGRTSSMAIGVRELCDVLDGDMDLPEAKSEMKKNTYQYARRQMIWLRAQKDTLLIHPEETTPAVIVDKILRTVS